MDLHELAMELSKAEVEKQIHLDEVEYRVQIGGPNSTVRLVKVRTMTTVMTNWVKPAALVAHIQEKIESISRK